MPFSCFEVTFLIPGAQSLKDKRMVVKSIKERARSRFNVSVAECGENDKWQKCVMCFALAAINQTSADKGQQDIIDFIGEDGRAEIISIDRY
jgi:uncharacterized protein